MPYPDVIIGTYLAEPLSVDMRAVIVLLEHVRPHADQFLTRVRIGDPYCAHCNRPLDLLRASWMADGIQIGYNCPDCKTEIGKDEASLFKDVTAEVRKNYARYWKKYQEAIGSLTKGKPHKFRLP